MRKLTKMKFNENAEKFPSQKLSLQFVTSLVIRKNFY